MHLLYPQKWHPRQAWSAYRIVQLRHQLGLTQREFAARVGCDETTVVRWERSRAAPSPVAQAALTRVARDTPPATRPSGTP